VQEMMATTLLTPDFNAQSLSMLATGLFNFNSLLTDTTFLLNQPAPDALTNLIANMATAEGAIKTGIQVNKGATALFKGGKLEVVHNLPNAKISVTVNLSAKDIAHGVADVSFNKGGTKRKIPSIKSGGATKIPQ